jgi:outer membrane protein insertion porin family
MVAASCLVLAVALEARAVAPRPAAATHVQVSVLVGLRAFEHPGADRQGGAPEDWLTRFDASLTESGVRVAGHRLVEGQLLRAAQDPIEALLAQARALGTPYVVVLSITRAAGSFGLDATVWPAQGGAPLLHRAANGELAQFPAELRRMADRVSSALREWRTAAPPVLAQQAELGELLGDAPELEPEASRRVIELRIDGNRRIEADAVRAVIHTRVGDRVNQRRISSDVKRIYELGFFSDVQVFSTSLRGGQLITFVVSENPIIRQVTITGNEELGGDDIQDRLTVTVGSTVDYPLLIENEQRIEALYQSEGYFVAEVEYNVEALAEGAVRVDFDIIEGNKHRLRTVEFIGNKEFDDGDLRGMMESKPWGWTSYVSQYWDNSGLYAEPIFYQDLDRIIRAYLDRGFIRVNVGSPQVTTSEERWIDVTVTVEEGRQHFVGQVDVIGDDSTDRDRLRDLLELREGELFNRSVLSDDVERLQSRYADRGFYEARVRPRTDVDPDLRTVDVVFEVEKGELFFIDWIKVSGNRRTRDPVVRRELSLAEGDLYMGDALERSRARIRRLGYFEEVSLETEETAPGRLGVTVDVVERATGSFNLGAGFGSTDGLLLNASVRQDNLFGRGYSLQASVNLGSENRYGSLSFTNPYFRGTPFAVSLAGQFSEVEFLDFDQKILGFSIGVGYPLDEGETRGHLNYSYSDRSVEGLTGFQAASLLLRQEAQGSTDTSQLTVSLRRDTRDDIRFPKEGQILGFAIDGAGLGGLNKFIRFEARVTRYTPLRRFLDSTFIVNSRFGWALPLNDIGDFDLTACTSAACATELAGSTELGALTSIDDDLELSLTERYFLGGLGAFQVRGFKQRSLGPRRPILTPEFVAGGGTLFHSAFRNTGAGPRCIDAISMTSLPDDSCNDLNDKDIDDFENLDLADVIGGNKMFLLNLEWQAPISEELGLTGIVFFDMGNAFAEDESMNPADLRFGTGAGVQWFSPFGPILLELGIPLDRLEDEDASVFEFSLGGSQF